MGLALRYFWYRRDEMIILGLFCDVGQNPCGAVTKDENRTPRRAGACLPPIDGGREARRYAELETAPLESMCSTHRSNELMSQPPCDFDNLGAAIIQRKNHCEESGCPTPPVAGGGMINLIPCFPRKPTPRGGSPSAHSRPTMPGSS